MGEGGGVSKESELINTLLFYYLQCMYNLYIRKRMCICKNLFIYVFLYICNFFYTCSSD